MISSVFRDFERKTATDFEATSHREPVIGRSHVVNVVRIQTKCLGTTS